MIAVLNTLAASMSRQPIRKRPLAIIHSPAILNGNSSSIGRQRMTSATGGGRRDSRASIHRSRPKRPSQVKKCVSRVHSHSSNRNSNAPTKSSAVRQGRRA